MNLKQLVYLLFVLLVITPFDGSGQTSVKRRILGIYNSIDDGEYGNTNMHLHAEYVLNYLGFIVDPWDISRGIPKIKDWSSYAAIFIWFENDRIPFAETYINWLHQILDKNIKLIIWDNIGAFHNQNTKAVVPINKINSVLNRLGISFATDYQDNPLLFETIILHKKMMEFERSLENEIGIYGRLQSQSSANKVYLSIKLRGIKDSQNDLSIITPQGAVVWGNNILYRHVYRDNIFKKEKTLLKWRLNPFLFFQKVLKTRHIPKMDACIKNGRRIYYSHIDGDGFANFTRVEDDMLCGEVVHKHIFKKYRLPISVSFIGCEIDPQHYGDKRGLETLGEMASLPTIEIASHSFSHPFVWSEKQKFKYKDTYKQFMLPVKGYKFNLEKEIKGSVDYLNSLLKPFNKTCSLFFWTGNCEPELNAVTIMYKYGIRNINGGESRFDRKFNSYAHINPLGKHHQQYLQIYTSNCNETIYTNGWQGPFNGFEKVIETFKNTNTAMCYRPMNVYYHFYSGEKIAGLRALVTVYDYILSQSVNPIFTSEYVDIVLGYFSARITKSAKNTWKITNNGKCRTVRFDFTDKKPDLSVSKNVIGFHFIKRSLYVFLGNHQESRITLIPRNAPAKAVYLASTNTHVQRIKRTKNSMFLAFSTFLEPEFTFAGFPSNQKVTIQVKAEKEIQKFYGKVNAQGRLSYKIPKIDQPGSFLMHLAW